MPSGNPNDSLLLNCCNSAQATGENSRGEKIREQLLSPFEGVRDGEASQI